MNDHLKQQTQEHHERKSRAHEALAQLDWQLARGEIDKTAYDFHVFRLFGPEPHKTLEKLEMHSRALHNTKHVGGPRTIEAALLAIVIIGLMGIMLFASDFSTTGLSVFEEIEQEAGLVFTGTGEYSFNTSNTTTLKVSGELNGGRATLHAVIDGARYLVLEKDTSTLTGLWLDKRSYSLARNIEVTVLPDDASYTLWLTPPNGEKIPVNEPLTTGEGAMRMAGSYTLEAIINASGEILKKRATIIVRNDTDPLLDEEADAPAVVFTDTCVETCTLSGASEITLEADVSEGAELRIETITINQQRENSAPVQIADIPNIAVEGSATLDLGAYFADPDRDSLVYDINNIIGVQEEIDGEMLTLTGDVPGTYEAVVYASDLNALAQSNTFTITVIGDVTPTTTENNTGHEDTHTNETKNTNKTVKVNETGEETTTETTENVIVEPAQTIGTCDDPNVNLRPASCFSDVLDQAFVDIVAPLNNKEQTRVGRVTRFGNLIIGGRVIEASTESSSGKDFKVGYSERKEFTEEYIATAWIDSDTGDLHLRGQLHEENGQLEAPQFNSYTIRNENGIVLAYFDSLTGDLYLKGNVVQLGKV